VGGGSFDQAEHFVVRILYRDLSDSPFLGEFKGFSFLSSIGILHGVDKMEKV
jgi:hypothetical protein